MLADRVQFVQMQRGSSVLSTGSPATRTDLLGYFAPGDTNVFAGPCRRAERCGFCDRFAVQSRGVPDCMNNFVDPGGHFLLSRREKLARRQGNAIGDAAVKGLRASPLNLG